MDTRLAGLCPLPTREITARRPLRTGSEQKLSRFRAGNRAAVCQIKCREQATRQRGPPTRLTKRDAPMMEESFCGEYRLSLLDHRPDERRTAARWYGATATVRTLDWTSQPDLP